MFSTGWGFWKIKFTAKTGAVATALPFNGIQNGKKHVLFFPLWHEGYLWDIHSTCLMKSLLKNFRVVDETDELLVVDKPAGILVHPTRPDGVWTLWDGVRELLAYELVNGGQVGIVNRLDRETSGLVLITKDRMASRRYMMAMAEGEIHKEYLALVFGWPREDRFVVDQPIIRQGEVKQSAIWLKRMVHPSGKPARTGFEVLRRFKMTNQREIALIRAFPETGRTHQIRVHLAWLGFPIVGDKIYGESEQFYLTFIEQGWTPAMEAALVLRNHALHSAVLKVGHRKWEGCGLPPEWGCGLRTADFEL